ncbi:MAG: class I SAM-dependent methyltransferase [Lachnospiraceae bacterium]|nr:class I SAM-dependent methyltransferase [Lachnospiraceae bacterium]
MDPKPIFNLKWYQNKDMYSEGEVEDMIIRLIAQNVPEDYVDAIYDHYSWSTFYHLSHVRQNILNWYPFQKDAEVLEIGCGMGAITGMLCDKVSNVTAVELSQRRAIAALLRCRRKENLEIIVGNLNDIKFEKKFDYITLIGVLEYQGSYTNGDNPYLDFLKKIKSLLKPNGRLLIAIENQYGLKYWCGSMEDHTGVPFDGINGYGLTDRKVRTFSRKALKDMIEKSGFLYTFFYYPMPDYKLPTVIYSEKKLPTDSNMQNMQPYYIPNNSTLIADETEIYQDLINNNVFEFFANSFLVECTNSEIDTHITFVSINTARVEEYRIGTRIIEENTVEKFMISNSIGRTHLDTIKRNAETLSKRGIHVVPGKYGNDFLVFKYIKNELLETRFIGYLEENNAEAALSLLDRVYADILNSSEKADNSENIIYTFGLNVPRDFNLYGTILKMGYIDMILRNAFVVDNEIVWFDQEWVLENIPAGFVMYRLLKEFYASRPEMELHLKIALLAERYGLVEVWDIYNQVEALFLGAVIDSKFIAECSVFSKKNKNDIRKNIYKLTS